MACRDEKIFIQVEGGEALFILVLKSTRNDVGWRPQIE